MNKVTFGTYDSYDDLSLVLTKKTIGAATPKMATVDVPGSNGILDFTEYFGEINYNNRTLSFEFSTVVKPSEFLSLYSRIQNILNGRKMNIYLSDDPDFHYEGRVVVNEWASEKRIGKVVIEVDAAPYKLKNAVTVVSAIVTGATALNCQNLKKKVVPKITTSSEVTMTFGTYTKVFSGELTDENIVFEEGQNVLTFTPTTGSASVIIEYQEAGL